MDIRQKSIDNIRAIIAQTISNANSGHTGSALSATPMLFSLFNDHLTFNPKDTNFFGRDRLVMSAGHTSALYYTLLHLFGYDISIDDLKSFRKYKSRTPGHPEYEVTPGVETSTGPLGQGIANAVGLAIGETIFASNFNTKDIRLFDNYTYCYTGDGCLMEGVAVEACSVAGTLKLNKLILLYEDNNITIDGTRTISNGEDTARKFEAMGWNVIQVKNGNDSIACSKAIASAKNSSKPTIIIFKTIIGYGTELQGKPSIHAHPLSKDELETYLNKLGINGEFKIDSEVYESAKTAIEKNIQKYNNWNELFKTYATKYPENYKNLKNYLSAKTCNYEKVLSNLINANLSSGRDMSGFILNELSKIFTSLVGGAADVAASTKALINDAEFYSSENRLGRNIHYGIREHSMGSISNGIALYLKQPVFDSTFFVFSNYMIPSIRMRSMMNLPILSIFTHDSINVGQDGPTHQPIETLTTLRSIPNYLMYRPATPAEAVAGYKLFFDTNKPVGLAFSKTNLSNWSLSTIDSAERGGYVIYESKSKPKIEIFATGTEVELAIQVADFYSDLGVRVISMPCESLFASQEKTYKNKVLLKNPMLKIAIEASNDNVWYKYIGEDGLLINVTDYQYSGSGTEVYQNAGFSKESIISKINKALKALE